MDMSARLERSSPRAHAGLASAAVEAPDRAVKLPQLSVAAVVEADVPRKRVAGTLERGGLRVALQVSASEELAALDGDAVDAVVLACDRLAPDHVAEVRAVRERLPGARIVLVVASTTRSGIREILAEGVDGLVLEGKLEEALALAVRSVCSGQVTLPSEVREHVTRPALSPREKQILAMVVMGFSNAEIATKLYLAQSTVKSHLSSAFAKLGVRSRNEATALILDPERGLGTGILAISEGGERLGPGN
jgi:DNA-binding NarL/FixJ family response regulator